MHSVERSPEPDFLARMRTENTAWDDLDTSDRVRIRGALAHDFEPACAYCEQDLELSTGQATVEHFRPRSRFPDLTFDWLNLVYACRRCNQTKGDNWPGFDDQGVGKWLRAENPRYTPVSGYVSPNAEPGRRPAQEYFGFDVDTGEMKPAEELDDLEWSTARRTIRDVDLNDSQRGEHDPGHLLNRRRRQRRLLEQRLSSVSDPIQMVELAIEFTQPGRPFSSYVAACFTDRFGGLP